MQSITPWVHGYKIKKQINQIYKMAIIYSYPKNRALKPTDSLLGSGDDNITTTYLVSELITYINGASIWGKIYGNLSDQTDLWDNLNTKALKSTVIATSAPLSGGGDLSSNRTISISQAGASSNGYLSSIDWNTFNNKQPAGPYITALSGEASATGPGSVNITLSNTAVLNKLLTNLTIAGNSIESTDTMLTAFGKLQSQINSVIGGVMFQSTWDASSNTPTLTSSVGTKGYYYVVSVAGSTNLNGITDWQVGDWAIYNGSVWQKIDNTDSVVTVNGLVGNVVLTTSNINEGSNLYYTEARVNANANVSANTAARHNAVTIGTANGLGLSGQQLSLGLSGSGSTGALSSSDWNTFNGKQNIINGTGFVKASGTNISYDNSTYTPTSTTITINGNTQSLGSNPNFTVNATSVIAGNYRISTGASNTIYSPTNAWQTIPEMTIEYIPAGSAIYVSFSMPVTVLSQNQVTRYRVVISNANGTFTRPYNEYDIYTNSQMITVQDLLLASDGVLFGQVNTIRIEWYSLTSETVHYPSDGNRMLICTPFE